MLNIVYMVRGYRKDNGECSCCYTIQNISPRRLAEVFGATDEDMSHYGDMPVTEEQVDILEEDLGVKLDLKKYDYQVGPVSV